MGMDLLPIQPTVGYATPLSYNWAGWRWLRTKLNEWNVDTSHLRGSNDGDEIPSEKCCEIADAIEAHLYELDECEREWLRPHIVLWRTCGGYEQW
jgi:hypothetical protein